MPVSVYVIDPKFPVSPAFIETLLPVSVGIGIPSSAALNVNSKASS